MPYRLSELSRRDLLIRGGQGGAAVFGLSALLAACGGSSSSSNSSSASSSSTSSASGTPKKGGDLVFARSVAPTTLDPANTIIAGDIYTLNQIFEPLFITNPNGTLAPWLAKSFTTSSNHLTWTFNLRPGVKFSDGKPLTADDVVFSIKREAANSDGPLSFLDFAIKSVTAKGSSTVVIKLKTPWAPFESDMSVFANAILPANFGGKSEKAFFESPIGTGPFTLASWTPDSNLTLKANPSYWQPGKPYVDSVTINYVTAVADQLGAQPVQVLVARVLVQFQMAGRMKRDRVGTARLAMDPQRDLLGHRPAREHGRGLEPQEPRHPFLEGRHQLAVPVLVGPVIRRQRVRRGPQAIGRGQRFL
jgi:hypothetical protein